MSALDALVAPIVVYKSGRCYTAADGSSRLAIAASMGRAFILAEVWELLCSAAPRPRLTRIRPGLTLGTYPFATNARFRAGCTTGMRWIRGVHGWSRVCWVTRDPIG
jgi:hypothetical protein